MSALLSIYTKVGMYPETTDQGMVHGALYSALWSVFVGMLCHDVVATECTEWKHEVYTCVMTE